MEKFPLNKFNKIRKVASAAIHLASMDPTHPAISHEGHTINAMKRPDSEIAQVQESASVSNKSQLDEQLKNQTVDYFNKEKESA
jgi:hypothetical protein